MVDEQDQNPEEQDTELSQQPAESEDWQAKAAEYESGWKRALADLDNYRKDVEKRQGEMVQFLKANTVSKFLDIYDDLERALKFVTEEKAKEGLMDVQKKFRELLSAEGFEQIDLEPGTEFDPAMAEAISYEENEVGEGKVIETVERGLKFGDRVVKPAKVRVGK